MKKIASKCLVCFVIILIALSFSTVLGVKVYIGEDETYSDEEIAEIRDDVGSFEVICSSFGISMGDYAQKYLSKIFGEDITIDKIVYNKVELLNANLFENSANSATSDIATVVRNVVNRWYSYLKRIAIVLMLISLIGAGIKILLNTPEKKVAAYDALKRVILGFALIFFFPYVMRYTMELNEGIVKYIEGDQTSETQSIGSPITQRSDLKPEEEEEFRNPQYVVRKSDEAYPGSVDATRIYLDRMEQYQESVDIMRLMRACAGVTLKFIYVVLWFILLVQTYILTFIYIKRFLIIVFLIAIYPIVVMGYVMEGLVRNGKGAFNLWCKHFFANVFLQTFHAIIYGIISQIVFGQIQQQLIDPKSTRLNVILMIVSISFLFSGEKIVNRFWKASTSTSGERKSLREIFGAPRRLLGNLRGK